MARHSGEKVERQENGEESYGCTTHYCDVTIGVLS
ncbi:hypothetical protein J2S17_005744 [Cytobacillus purgationiresistens]|uniref:Uncharacterized protein n=1 Tax=Cytobacillus purgationiresistens TaxID=863449 RepID=A0ABU0ARX8_9BACI|nr:hypothetical protein [Cytobacillus purgationiresistens]